MMKNRLYYFLLIIMWPFSASAQEKATPMADAFRENGKIYVVVGVILIILVGLIAYLFLLDRKISRLEKKVTDK